MEIGSLNLEIPHVSPETGQDLEGACAWACCATIAAHPVPENLDQLLPVMETVALRLTRPQAIEGDRAGESKVEGHQPEALVGGETQ